MNEHNHIELWTSPGHNWQWQCHAYGPHCSGQALTRGLAFDAAKDHSYPND